MSDPQIVFEFKRNENDCGFKACTERDFVFKQDKYSAAIIPLDLLIKNLRLMVKTKQARLMKVGTTEAVAIPRSKLMELYK